MEQWSDITSSLVPLFMDDVDTDQIIPARYLTATSREGYGEKLFYDSRFDSEGNPCTDFPLNQDQYAGARVLLARKNFGCGSSREHAVWALMGYGFRAVIAISFADIFRTNACKNGLLPVALPEDVIDVLHAAVKRDPSASVYVSLEDQQVQFQGKEYSFDVAPFAKKCMLKGLDDIGYTLSYEEDIIAFERKR